MVTDRDAQGMSNRFMELARICHESVTDRHRKVCGPKNSTKDWFFDCFLNLQTLAVLVHSRYLADPAMLLQIFIPVEVSRM